MKVTINKSSEGNHNKIPKGSIFVIIGSDHAGYAAKQEVIKTLVKNKYMVLDVGGFDPESKDDYDDFAYLVGKEVKSDKSRKTMGILLCGSGTGMVMAANKIDGIRAALAFDKHSAIMARHDNDANVLCLRGLNFPIKTNKELALLFLQTPFSGLDRHKRRVQKLALIEQDKLKVSSKTKSNNKRKK